MTRLHRDEAGAALVLALLGVVILGGLVSVFVARANTESRASGFSRDHEATIHVAEAAADNQIAAVNADPDHVTVDKDGDPIQATASDVTEENEEAWVLGLLNRMQNSTDGWGVTGPGEAYAVRPEVDGEPLDVIYAVGAVPRFDHPNPRVRVIKLRIDKTDWIPEFALLTGGGLDFGGNAAIIVPGCESAVTEQEKWQYCTADVHANGAFTNPGSASQIQGQVSTATGTCPSGVTAVNGCIDTDDGVQAKDIPAFQARDFYHRDDEPRLDPLTGEKAEWFDLCPDQTIRPWSENGPCDTTLTAVWPSPAAPTNFKGWKWQAGEWRASDIEHGIFYVYHADAKVTGSAGKPSKRTVSIFVEQNPANLGGSGALDISGNPQMQSALGDVLIVADTDLAMQGTASAGSCDEDPDAFSGFIGVGEQLKTQGTVAIRGAIIVQDRADDHNLVKRNNDGVSGTMCLEFDPKLSIDFTGRWVVTYWNEL